MAKLDDDWVKDFIEEARKKPDTTKEEMQDWVEYCYLCLIDYAGMTDKVQFTGCYLTLLALLNKID